MFVCAVLAVDIHGKTLRLVPSPLSHIFGIISLVPTCPMLLAGVFPE